MKESKRKWKKKEFRRQTSLGRCRGVRGTRPSPPPPVFLSLEPWNPRRKNVTRYKRTHEYRTWRKRVQSSFEARFHFEPSERWVRPKEAAKREKLGREERRRGEDGWGEKEQREKCKNVFHYTRSKSVRISRLVFPRVALRSTIVWTSWNSDSFWTFWFWTFVIVNELDYCKFFSL